MSKEINEENRRAKLTPEEKAISKQTQRDRMRIANLIRRKPEIKKVCCICGTKNAEILHNKSNPFFITFICKECRANVFKLQEAEKHRFDIREVMNKSTLSTKNFSDNDVVNLVDGYLLKTISIGQYCEEHGISRYQFKQLVDRYQKLHKNNMIKKTISNHANKIHKEKLSKIAYERHRI